jgi:hypothetical protein
MTLLSVCITVFLIYTKQYLPKGLGTLSKEEIEKIKHRRCVVVTDIVDDEEATGWEASLKAYIKANLNIEGRFLLCARIYKTHHVLLFR